MLYIINIFLESQKNTPNWNSLFTQFRDLSVFEVLCYHISWPHVIPTSYHENNERIVAQEKEPAQTTIMIFFLIILLISRNMLIINTNWCDKMTKKQIGNKKIKKPKNENICLTYLDAENNGNFHFLSLEGYDYLRICGLKMEHITYTISQYL